jgi:hypothetical protein
MADWRLNILLKGVQEKARESMLVLAAGSKGSNTALISKSDLHS